MLQLLLATLMIQYVEVHKAKLTNWLKETNKTAVACQGESTDLACGDYEGVRIVDAFWGRDDKLTCQSQDPLSTQSTKEMCLPNDKDYAYRKVAESCQGRRECFVIATPLFFDTELCPHVRKYIRIRYECRQMSGMKRGKIWETLYAQNSLPEESKGRF